MPMIRSERHRGCRCPARGIVAHLRVRESRDPTQTRDDEGTRIALRVARGETFSSINTAASPKVPKRNSAPNWSIFSPHRSCPSPPGTTTSARARVVRGPIAPRVVVSMVATRSSTARARRDSSPDAPLVHWHVCVALIVAVTVASKFGDALAPTLVDTRPLTLLALNANDLHLALTAGRTKVRAAPRAFPVRACSSTPIARRDSTTTRRADLMITRPPSRSPPRRAGAPLLRRRRLPSPPRGPPFLLRRSILPPTRRDPPRAILPRRRARGGALSRVVPTIRHARRLRRTRRGGVSHGGRLAHVPDVVRPRERRRDGLARGCGARGGYGGVGMDQGGHRGGHPVPNGGDCSNRRSRRRRRHTAPPKGLSRGARERRTCSEMRHGRVAMRRSYLAYYSYYVGRFSRAP